jgi:hypothetical protein
MGVRKNFQPVIVSALQLYYRHVFSAACVGSQHARRRLQKKVKVRVVKRCRLNLLLSPVRELRPAHEAASFNIIRRAAADQSSQGRGRFHFTHNVRVRRLAVSGGWGVGRLSRRAARRLRKFSSRDIATKQHHFGRRDRRGAAARSWRRASDHRMSPAIRARLSQTEFRQSPSGVSPVERQHLELDRRLEAAVGYRAIARVTRIIAAPTSSTGEMTDGGPKEFPAGHYFSSAVILPTRFLGRVRWIATRATSAAEKN